METFRLEELLRLMAISVTSVLIGMGVFVLQAFAGESGGTSTAVVLLLVVLTFLVVATPVTLISGLGLHVLLRFYALPRVLLLPLFIGIGLLIYWLVIRVPAPSDLPVILSITITAWGMYSFGPLRLWKYEFEPSLHSDF